MTHNLSTQNSIFNSYIAEIRDEKIQKDSMRFRKNLERIAEIMAYEVSKTLAYKQEEVTTPLGVSEVSVLAEQPVLATILRAGLAMHQGFLNVFDHAESAFVSAYRKYRNAENFEIYVEYVTAPEMDGKVLIISDPMLATGASMVTSYKALLKYGKPSRVVICTAIASQEAINYVRKNFPANTEIYVGAVDTELTAQSYIVPGLGDVGDLAFGEKQ
ncbi:MAG TPA: uracil phosphoribosyltransferase [Crocinitomicaceae bacterium]|nr:uracil phosphoribosyltransferase [Crocinitomicaceae bacterium]